MAGTNGTVIRMENITKVFYADEIETYALSGIHIEIRKGEYVSVAGPSGAGKSTLLALIAEAVMDLLRELHLRGPI